MQRNQAISVNQRPVSYRQEPVLFVFHALIHEHPDSCIHVHAAWFTWHNQVYNLCHKSMQLFEVHGPDPQTSKHIPVWIKTYSLNQSPCTLQFYCNRICLIFFFFLSFFCFLLFFMFLSLLPLVEGLEAGVLLPGRMKRHCSFACPLHHVSQHQSSASKILPANAATRTAMTCAHVPQVS